MNKSVQRSRPGRAVLVPIVVAIAMLVAACGEPTARVGTDAGPLDTVTGAAQDPTTGPTPGTPPQAQPTPPGVTPPGVTPPGQTSPPASPSPSESPSGSASDSPSQSPSDTPSDDPSEGASSAPLAPPDLELDGWDLRVVGLIDPARADVLNAFAQRPVVVVLHAQADSVAAEDDAAPADDASIVDVVSVQVELDSGQVLDELGVFTGATTVECPAQVERRVVLRAGQGQRTCAVFDVPGTAEIAAVSVGADGNGATVDVDGIEVVNSISAIEELDIGVPESTLALGEVVEVAVDTATGDATVDMAVTAAEVVDDTDGRLVGITVELTSDADLFEVRFGPEMIAALSPDGVQRTRLIDETTADCRGTGSIDVPAGEAVSFCVPVLVPDEAITSHARFTAVQGPPQVWRVLRAGGTAGPGSNA